MKMLLLFTLLSTNLYSEVIDFSGRNLTDEDFSDKNLNSSSFKGANMTESKFSRVSCHKCDFSHANLKKVQAFGARLSHAVFYKTNLVGAHLAGTNLVGADLSEAIIDVSTNFFGAQVNPNTTKFPKHWNWPLLEAVYKGMIFTTEEHNSIRRK